MNVEWAKKEMSRTGKKQCNKDFIYYVMRGKTNNNRIDWIDLSALPKKEYKGKKVIDWMSKDKSDVWAMYENQLHSMQVTHASINEIYLYKDKDKIKVSATGLKKVTLKNLLQKPMYRIGEIVNGVKIINMTKTGNGIAYEVKDINYMNEDSYYIEECVLSKYKSNGKYTNSYIITDSNSLYSIESLRDYIIDIDKAKTMNKASKDKVSCQCPNCATEKLVSAGYLSTKGFPCKKCSPRVSFPEKVTMIFLEFINEPYTTQDNKILEGRRFDFILNNNRILEVNGAQHTEETNWNDAYKKTTLSDSEKRAWCKSQNIELLEIDAKYSYIGYILNNLNKLFNTDVKIDDIRNNVLKCDTFRKDVVNKYIDGVSVKNIALEFNIDITTVYKYLNMYNIEANGNKKKVKCNQTGDVFESATLAAKVFDTHASAIVKVCKKDGGLKSAGKHPTTGEKLTWEYVD